MKKKYEVRGMVFITLAAENELQARQRAEEAMIEMGNTVLSSSHDDVLFSVGIAPDDLSAIELED